MLSEKLFISTGGIFNAKIALPSFLDIRLHDSIANSDSTFVPCISPIIIGNLFINFIIQFRNIIEWNYKLFLELQLAQLPLSYHMKIRG